MNVIIPREPDPEIRVPMLPQNVETLVKRGLKIIIESKLGASLGIEDSEYKKAGAEIIKNRKKLFASGNIILRLQKPEIKDVNMMKKGAILIGFINPFQETRLIEKLARRQISTIAMEMIPRSTRAQKMDALSSQASLAGYAAVVLAANNFNKIFPMMMTPAGTLQPSRVFVIGAGVAGLQAIATARRLGAKVDAFDTRPAAKNDVLSLGAKFVEIELGETGQTEQGYAKALNQEQLKKQQEAIKRYCVQADIIISTAQVFGRKAPVIVTKEMLEAMRPGSVIVDLAIESGGNVEGSVFGKIVEKNGIKVIGFINMPSRVAYHASQMYSNNLTNLLNEFWNDEKKIFELKLDDEIIKSCLLTHKGSIVNSTLLSKRKTEKG